MRTATTLRLLGAIAGLQFKAMDRADFACFADAPADGQIAFAGSGDIVDLVGEALGITVMARGHDDIAFVLGDQVLEAHGVDESGDPFCLAIRLENAL